MPVLSRDRGDRKTSGSGAIGSGRRHAPAYTAKSGRITTGSNFQTYLYAPLKKSIVIS